MDGRDETTGARSNVFLEKTVGSCPSSTIEFATESTPGDGESRGARYRLMSPAKLPISRSPCFTIPPGMSPTSFLESPVLLSNLKAEASPTTGSLLKNQMMLGSVGSFMLPPTTNCSNDISLGPRQSSCSAFGPNIRSNPISGFSPPGPLVSADLNHQQGEQNSPIQGRDRSQLFASSPMVKNEPAVSSNELNIYTTCQMASGTANVPAEADSSELDHMGHSNTKHQLPHSDLKGNGPPVVADRLSDDGYNWRKYGQKHVKGSEFPRSYYKCTHPNCEVKKLFERTYEGQITEIIYKGTHDHPKPQPSRRYNCNSVSPIQEGRLDKILSSCNQNDDTAVAQKVDSINGATAESNRIHDDIDDDDSFPKRRKVDGGGIDVTPIIKPIREPRVVVQTLSEVDILDDGYRWRKYGQKVVRGNPNPRSYYKCTNTGCPVRKHVERASHDPKAVITTYEGKHIHDVPTAKTSCHEAAGPASANGMPFVRSHDRDAISLDLGVGISRAAEHRSNEHPPRRDTELVQSRSGGGNPNYEVVRTTPTPLAFSYYCSLNNGMGQYGSRENLGEGPNFGAPPLNLTSKPYPQNTGRIMLGP